MSWQMTIHAVQDGFYRVFTRTAATKEEVLSEQTVGPYVVYRDSNDDELRIRRSSILAIDIFQPDVTDESKRSLVDDRDEA